MDLLADLALAQDLARLGARVATQHFGGPTPVRVKTAPGDVVSLADEQSERAILDVLDRQRPDDGVLAEEGGRRPGTRTWLVDAVDGTLNFVKQDPFWSTAIALQDAHGALVAAVHHPATGETFSAARGIGCWLNDTPLRLPDGPALASAVVSTYLNPGDITSAPLQRVAAAAASLRIRGSGSIELAWIAAGRTDAWLQPNMKPWDRVPGSLLVQEAGGTTSTCSVEGCVWFIAGGRTTHADLLAALRETSG